MDKKRYPVKITRDGTIKTYSPDFQTLESFTKSWQSVLKRHHGTNALVQCMCPGKAERKFYIGLRQTSDLYYLSRFKNSGIEHYDECRWYSSASISGQQHYQEGVVTEDDNGFLRIRLAVSLNAGEPVECTPPPGVNENPQEGGRSKAQMKLAGLLSLLWTEAGLNMWYPKMEKKRFTSSVHTWLQQAACGIKVGRTTLNKVLLAGALNDSDQAKQNEQKLSEAAANNKRLVVTTSLAKWSAERECDPGRVPVKDFFGLPKLSVDASLWAGTLKSHPTELAAWQRDERIIVIALTDVPEGDEADVLRLALMHVSKRWIPLDSSLEGLVEDKLVREKRKFIKPMRFDAEKDDVFADFHLLDTLVHHQPLEVFGMDTAEYNTRKAVKMQHYDSKYGVGGWWYWDAIAEPDESNIPAFPPAKIRALKNVGAENSDGS
ncbi:DUF1173 family protein [Pantoea osteomyelitidis]|uniref:DUF1173 family protein n=1 Tax=Pantoea osteomyelitidis TaxID=3230026 RepID=A0ABW7Q1P0_9GAMM